MYIENNPLVQKGLTLDGVVWSFATIDATNYHPLTWLSYMSDITIYGINPGQLHLTNVLFHILSSILLFIVFRRMTSELWKSAFIATLFAIHPLHVETVAWIAERKDVLCTFFWMLTLWSYARYSEHPGLINYCGILFFFLLGLLSKPMIITLPFLLLVLDYWPLKRFCLVPSCQGNYDMKHSCSKSIFRFGHQFSTKISLLVEKLPLFILAAIFSIITLHAQQKGGAVASLGSLSYDSRIANALVVYIKYLIKMVIPVNLAVFYPHPIVLSLWKVVSAGFLLLIIFFAVIRYRKRHPYLLTGWLWYIGTLAPVIGLVQAGEQEMADRYTYVPLIGIFIMLAWGFSEFLGRRRYWLRYLSWLSVSVIIVLTIISWFQVKYWRNSITLFTHALDVTEKNYVAHNNLGNALYEKGKRRKALAHYYEAIKLNPGDAKLYFNIGNIYTSQGKPYQASEYYNIALKIDPGFKKGYINLGNVLSSQGKPNEAIKCYKKALRRDPNFVEAHKSLGYVLTNQGRTNEAKRHYLIAINLNQDDPTALHNLAVLNQKEDIYIAISKVIEKLNQNPENFELYFQLGELFGNLYHRPQSANNPNNHFEQTLILQPLFIQAMINLSLKYAIYGKYDAAQYLIRKMAVLRPNSIEGSYYIASIYARQSRVDESIRWLKFAVNLGFVNLERLKNDKDMKTIQDSHSYKNFIHTNELTFLK
ncbi:tetratricopeptide repeat protein [Desulfococcaceae bacterium HSG9]|nr:tetratricopeptide repeat protein [Desulfococcaceae bacterium HSG9]